MSSMRHHVFVLSLTALSAGQVLAEKKYGPGVTDTEIKIGQTIPYSGPASAFSLLGQAEAAYFAKVNDEGGINGRKIKLISLDEPMQLTDRLGGPVSPGYCLSASCSDRAVGDSFERTWDKGESCLLVQRA